MTASNNNGERTFAPAARSYRRLLSFLCEIVVVGGAPSPGVRIISNRTPGAAAFDVLPLLFAVALNSLVLLLLPLVSIQPFQIFLIGGAVLNKDDISHGTRICQNACRLDFIR